MSLADLTAGLDDWRREALETVRQSAIDANLRVYLVGGPVRDALLGSAAQDLDFSVEGDAIALARRVAEALGGTVTAHSRFGTATVTVGQNRVDLVTARRESYPRPGDLPRVAPGTISDDLARRDFSINALALPLWGPESGILDLHGGLEDLSAGTIRSLHRGSFVDDPTRMMRAARYEQRFGFRIHEDTLADMAGCVAAGHMDAVSGDRWRHELERILDEDDPGPALLRAGELGLLEGIHPFLWGRGAQLCAPAWAARLSTSPSRVAPCGRPQADDWLAALFSPLTATEGEGVIRRLRVSGHREALARDTIVLRDSEPKILAAAGRPSRLTAMLSALEPSAVSAWAKLTGDPVVSHALRRYVEELRFVRPRLSGDTLLNLGVRQGPEVGAILARLLNARLDGEAESEDDEIALAKELLAGGRHGLGE